VGQRGRGKRRGLYFFLWKGKQNHQFGTGFLVHYRIVSASKILELVGNWMSYVVLRGCWCNIIVLNVHAPSEEKSDDSKGRFYEVSEQVFFHFPKYNMKILLGDFNEKVGRERIFKSTIVNESLHQGNNDNGVRIVNFATKNNLVVKSTLFQHQNTRK